MGSLDKLKMKNISGVVIISVLALVVIANTSRQFVPLPAYDISNIGQYRLALELSTSAKALHAKYALSHAHEELCAAEKNAALAGIQLVDNTTPPPAGDDAGPMYIHWQSDRDARHFILPLYAEPLTLNFNYTPTQIGAVQKQFDEHQDLNRELTKAVDTPFLYSTDLMTGANPGIQVLGPVCEAARTIETKANLLALRGRWQQAADESLQNFKIVNQMQQQHSLTGCLTGLAVQAIAIGECDILLSRSKPDAVLCSTFRLPITRCDNQKFLKQGVKWGVSNVPADLRFGERSMTVGSVTNVDQGIFTGSDKTLCEDIEATECAHEVQCIHDRL